MDNLLVSVVFGNQFMFSFDDILLLLLLDEFFVQESLENFGELEDLVFGDISDQEVEMVLFNFSFFGFYFLIFVFNWFFVFFLWGGEVEMELDLIQGISSELCILLLCVQWICS